MVRAPTRRAAGHITEQDRVGPAAIPSPVLSTAVLCADVGEASGMGVRVVLGEGLRGSRRDATYGAANHHPLPPTSSSSYYQLLRFEQYTS